MIAACPKCQTRYRLKPEQFTGEGLKLRCRRCSAIFRVRAPKATGAPDLTAPRAEQPAAHLPPSTPEPSSEAGPRVVLALPETDDAAASKRWLGALQRWGLRVTLTHDGVEAMLGAARELPQAVVAHASLARMNGIELCELMKRNADLRGIPLILIASREDAEELAAVEAGRFGADAYLEFGSAPEALRDRLERLGLALNEAPAPLARPATGPRGVADAREAAAPPQPAAPLAERSPDRAASQSDRSALSGSAVPPAAGSQPVATQTAVKGPTPTGPEGAVSEARSHAERLARIAVSDIVLYNEEKFAAAIERGDVLEAMRDELEEGRCLLRDRVPAEIFAERDYMGDELVRIARMRGEAG